MPLSDEEKKRIEEEEYRKHVQSQLETTERKDVNINAESRLEHHGVGREVYRDTKKVGGGVVKFFTEPINDPGPPGSAKSFFKAVALVVGVIFLLTIIGTVFASAR